VVEETVENDREPSVTLVDEQAPSPWSLIAAIMIAILIVTLIPGRHAYGLAMPRHAFSPWALVFAIPAILTALMTRRSPMPVTIAATTLMMVMHPRMLFAPSSGILAPVLMGVAVWLACTRSPIPGSGLRRAPGETMPLRIWIPAIALVLTPLPFIARAMFRHSDAPMGMVTAMFVMPVVFAILTSWIVAFATDRFGAAIGRDALRRSTPTILETED